MFRALTEAELRLTGRLSLPTGTSVVSVARKPEATKEMHSKEQP